VLYHIIRFAFEERIPAQERDEVIRQMNGFANIAGVIDARVGIESAGPDQEFTHALVVTMEGEEQYEGYQAHPTHVEAALYGVPKLSKMQMVDIVMDPAPGVQERLAAINARLGAEYFSGLGAHMEAIAS